MEKIKLDGTDDTPGIILDAENGMFEIYGRSMPEDVETFFDPILSWLEAYAENTNEKTEFIFKMNYFNTASSKLLLDVLMILEEIYEDGNAVLVKWYFPEDDEDMEEAGEEYADIVEIPFEHIPYSK